MTYQAREPVTPMERLQEQVEAMYASEDRELERERFDEAPGPMCRRCNKLPADGSGIMCQQCWIETGPYDRSITEEQCDE